MTVLIIVMYYCSHFYYKTDCVLWSVFLIHIPRLLYIGFGNEVASDSDQPRQHHHHHHRGRGEAGSEEERKHSTHSRHVHKHKHHKTAKKEKKDKYEEV